MSDTVLYEVRGHVAIVTLNRPERMNAWTGELGTAYYDALDRAAAYPNVRVIVLTGAGRGFCPGADMDVLSGNAATVAGGSPDPRRAGHAMRIPKPVICAINGACAGLGLVVALSCDIRFAAAGAKFTTAFSRRGLIAEYGVSWTLPRLVGQSIALDLLMSGRVFQSDEAKQLGVVNDVFAPEQLMEHTLAYAHELATKVSPTSMGIIKQQVYNHGLVSYEVAETESIELMKQSLSRSDFKEGVQSYLQRRDPNFNPYSAS
jgi:enoyl-CoA hydratase/carnithine racemase